MNEKKSIKTSDGRVRNIALMLYEDSCTPNWQELLEERHIPSMWVYHDKDVNPTGEPKKPHWHVMLCFEGKKSHSQLQEYADLLGGANGQYIVVESLRGYARYLCHLDNPEKAQYDSGCVHAVAMDYNSMIGMASDKYRAVGEMMDFCDAENIVSYYELLSYSRIHRFDWFRCLCDNSSMVMIEFLKSKKWTEEQKLLKAQRGCL